MKGVYLFGLVNFIDTGFNLFGKIILKSFVSLASIPNFPKSVFRIEYCNAKKINYLCFYFFGCIWTTIKLATNMLEYVPTKTPTINANEK